MFRRFGASFCACFFVFALCAPLACATGVEPSGGGIGIPVGLQIQLDVVDFWESCGDGLRHWGNRFAHVLDEDVCPDAPQVGGGHNFIPRRTLKDGQVGLYYVCEYCGKAYGEALEEAYQEYVETLPGTTYNSDGAFLWVPGASDFTQPVSVRLYINSTTEPVYSYPARAVTGVLSGQIYQYTYSFVAYVGDCLDVSSSSALRYSVAWGAVSAPVTGIYTAQSGFYDSSSPAASVQRVGCNAGDSIILSSSGRYTRVLDSWLAHYSFSWPKFWVEPYAGGSGGNTYDIATRFSGSVSDGGSFGYVQDGTLYQSTVGTIYNETTNVYQNPVTGETSGVSSWNYDYSDRSYTLTTDEGDEITVTYGDSAVTINEGGATYNVYYLMEETEDVQEALESYCDHDYASTVTTAPTCTASGVRTYACSKCGASYAQTVPPTGHNYQSAVTMAPTCVNTGVRTFTCSNCGDSYTVSLPATGHVWEVVRTVLTTYDNDTGQLVQQGYTLYECSVCHEQYRIDADSGGSSLPAPSSGGTSTGGSELVELDSSVGRGFLAIIAHGLTEDLPAAVRAASSWFTELPRLYEGYTGFMAASVSWLPSDIQALLRFAVGFVTFVGIIRRLWGRG